MEKIMHKKRDDITKELLKELVVIQGKSQKEVAKELKCTDALISKKLKSYGLSKKIEDRYIGKRFGLLTPLSVAGYDKHSHIVFNCFCECGKELEVLGNSLITGNTTTCGCESRKRGKNHANWTGYEEIRNSYWTSLKTNAFDRGFCFDVSIEQAWDLFIKQGRKCALTGRQLIFAPVRKKQSVQTASLDRINSSKGYRLDNIQWVHKTVNQMKMNLTQEDFIKICQEVVNYNG